jgi:hypothetical protein
MDQIAFLLIRRSEIRIRQVRDWIAAQAARFARIVAMSLFAAKKNMRMGVSTVPAIPDVTAETANRVHPGIGLLEESAIIARASVTVKRRPIESQRIATTRLSQRTSTESFRA